MPPNDTPVGQVLTYRQATRRALAAVLAAQVGGFAAISATRLQLAADLTTPLAFDLIVWTAMVTVAVVAVVGAGVCAWMRVADRVAARRRQVRERDRQASLDTMPLPVMRAPMTSAVPVPVVGGRHRLEVTS